MREHARRALAGALAAGLAGPAGAGDAPAEAQPFALRLSVEMAAHRRLIEVMERADHRPDAFATDGCSGGLSTAWELIADLLPPFAETHEARPPWESCCIAHDRTYHAAGGARSVEDSYRARFSADETLRACVIETGVGRVEYLAQTYGLGAAQVEAAYGLIADAMFDAVRLGGGPCSGLPWRWGYGYPGCLIGE
ncbi:hypothetical protein SAMN05444722_1523 [Rhodovulum sp. ES.010]|uniref:hypothetical protein n=1 Tax=Rhodovulum sp. ES.010 TaxID=1882821 RepID=UPI00092A3478|nr:hypothetical protein [Rhodovulum sp. ES.010]SIO33861.1 hypothetical protein SAMN05444722_1523 [Rhodovulum sp. ES.010]